MRPPYFLSIVELRALSDCAPNTLLTLSLDLGRTRQPIRRTEDALELPGGFQLPLPPRPYWAHPDKRTILIFRDCQWEKWRYFDPQTNAFYKPVFVAEGQPPTVEISGIKMHVTDTGGPLEDTRRKIQALGKVNGRVLDTCCGLGYTAMALGRIPTVFQVITFEKDKTMLRISRENPWSRDLFRSTTIQVLRGDVFQCLSGLPAGIFQAVLHDPPRFSLAPELYSVEFYREVFRVLRTGGRLYHYTGNPRKHRHKGLPERTLARLQEVGFSRARRGYRGVCARKR